METKPKRKYVKKQTPDIAKTSMIQATSRVSAKIKDSFYTFEFVEQLTLDADKNYKIEIEKEDLWQRVHEQVDMQLEQILEVQK